VFLFAETAASLEEGNSYSLPAGKHRLWYALNADDGKTAAVWVSRFDSGPTSNPAVVQYFDLKTGRIRREERYAWFEKGGLAAGGKEEGWLRKVLRTYDAQSGQLLAEQVFRCEGSTFVPVIKR
jgi:hypothetical protein